MKSRTNEMGVPEVTSLAEAIAKESVDKLRDTYLPWIERALEVVSHEQLWQRPRDGVNSIGNLLLHLRGNVGQWMISGVGGAPDIRNRDSEFSAEQGEEAAVLFGRLKETVERACEVILEPRTEEEWIEQRTIQRFSTTTLAAVYHVVEHFSYHTGQIVILAKAASGVDIGFYDL